MTANDLRKHLNETYGMDKQWPALLRVDADTYAQCVRAIIDNAATRVFDGGVFIYTGPHGGPLFKNVELILGVE